MKYGKAHTSSSQTNIQQHCTDPVLIVMQKGKSPPGIGATFHPEQVFKNLIENGQIQFGIIDDQQCIPHQFSPPSF